MSTSHAKRRQGTLARFADLFRYDPARPPRPVVNVAPGVEIPAPLAPEARETAGRPAMPAWAQRPPWDSAPGQMTEPFNPFNPEETETWGPDGRPDRLLMDEQALTDGRVAPGYVPEAAPPYVPDFRADYRDLPVFRATLRVRGWCGLATGNRAGTLPDFGLRRAA